MTCCQLAKHIDHTLLQATATVTMIDNLCAEADANRFAAVCVNPWHVRRAAMRLNASPTKVCTVIGFPLGATSKEVKAFEASQAVEDGAEEVDMVMNTGALKSGDIKYLADDICSVVNSVGRHVLTKVILETCFLDESEIRLACRLACDAGADFVKTSTGFAAGGATVEAVRIMADEVGGRLGIKASGGIRDHATAMALIKAGATRLGISASLTIIDGCTCFTAE